MLLVGYKSNRKALIILAKQLTEAAVLKKFGIWRELVLYWHLTGPSNSMLDSGRALV